MRGKRPERAEVPDQAHLNLFAEKIALQVLR